MSNNNAQVKVCHVANSSLNDKNSSVKVRNLSLYGTNSSLGNNVSKQPAKCSESTKSHPLLKGEKKWCNTGDYPFFVQVCKKIYSLAIPLVEPTHHQLNNTNRINEYFITADSKRCHGVTTNCSAAKPSRHSSAIFMSKICLTNYQRFTNGINKNTSALQSRHKYSVNTIGTNTYDRSSEPNKIPLVGNKLRRLNTVVNGVSPSFSAGNNKLIVQDLSIMGNSIRTTSKNITSTLATNKAIFAIGRVVLCPSLSSEPFTLIADPYGQCDLLALSYDGSYHYYDAQGYYIRANDNETANHQTSLFYDTLANRQAINTLYGNTCTTKSSQRNVIDTTDDSDDEVILLTSGTVSNAACEVYGAAEALDDISSGKISQGQAVSLARIAQVTADTWSEILRLQLAKLNEPLSYSKFGKVGE